MPERSAARRRSATTALEFDNPSSFAAFLLTCLEDPEFARGSHVYREHLNRVFVRKASPHLIHVRLAAPTDTLEQLIQIARANGGEAKPRDQMTDDYQQATISNLMKRVILLEAPRRRTPDQLVLAMWDCSPEKLREVLLMLNTVSEGRTEVAFVRKHENRTGQPTHLIRVQDARHMDAVLHWAAARPGQVEPYAPLDAEGGPFYVSWGYRFPIPGLDRLVEGPSELVLLRRRPGHRVPEWILFELGQVNFFRKLHEILEAHLEAQPVPTTVLEEDRDLQPLAMEIGIQPDAHGAPSRLWQLDKIIDRHRRRLIDLERRRLRVATGRTQDFYLTYKFFQGAPDRLNPLLVRFMQQRLTVLAEYTYAFCRPGEGAPFHLVIAQRTQRDLGFGLQLADAAYQQSEEFRRWGVNLYLPLGRRLVPLVDEADAIPMLQQLLEKRDAAGRDTPQDEIAKAEAILWDDLGNGRIAETRVLETQPLLSQYRLLNSFQRADAARVAEQTRTALIEELKDARRRVAVTCRNIEQEILTYLAGRCEDIETAYGQLHTGIRRAEEELDKLQPQIREVAAFVRSLPRRWARFVGAVLELNRQLAQQRLDAYEALRTEFAATREQIHAAALRRRDLTAHVETYRNRAEEARKALDQDVARGARLLKDAETLNIRLYELFCQIRQAYEKLAARLKAIAAARQKADRIQAAIDSVDRQEREVKLRLKRLEALRDEIRSRQEALKAQAAKAQAAEADAASKLAEVAQAEDNMLGRTRQAAERLTQLEGYLQRIALEVDQAEELFNAIDEEAALLERRATVVDRWRANAARWAEYLNGEHARLDQLSQEARRIGGSG